MRTSQNTAETINTSESTSARIRSICRAGQPRCDCFCSKGNPSSASRRSAIISRCRIGMETCSGTHFIARQLAALGHDVRLIQRST